MNSPRFPIGLALCGAGARARVLFGHLLRKTSAVQLRAVYEPDPAAVAGLSQWSGSGEAPEVSGSLEKLLEVCDVDWVAVNSPNGLHAHQIVAALQSGKHVFSEKPLATTWADCLAIQYAVSCCERKFFFGLVLRSSPFYRRMKGLIDAGELGKILSFEFNETLAFQHGGFIMGDWRRRREQAGTLLLEKCCHDIDLANWLTGSLPTRVASMGGCRFFVPENARHMDRIGLDDLGHRAYLGWEGKEHADPFVSDKNIFDHQVAILEYASGAKASFHTNLNAALPERRFYILGSEGAIRGDVLTGVIEWARIDHKPSVHREQNDAKGGHGGADDFLAEHLLATMLEGATPTAGIQEAMEASAVCFAIDEASETGTVVNLASYWADMNHQQRTDAAASSP